MSNPTNPALPPLAAGYYLATRDGHHRLAVLTKHGWEDDRGFDLCDPREDGWTLSPVADLVAVTAERDRLRDIIHREDRGYSQCLAQQQVAIDCLRERDSARASLAEVTAELADARANVSALASTLAGAGEQIKRLQSTPPGAFVLAEDAREAIANLIDDHLQAIVKHGFIVPACEDHGRDHVCRFDDGSEGCTECSADGFSGELCNLATDSEAISMADKIINLLRTAAPPASLDEVTAERDALRCQLAVLSAGERDAELEEAALGWQLARGELADAIAERDAARAESARLRMELDASCNAEELRQVRAELARVREALENLIAAMSRYTICGGKDLFDAMAAARALSTPPTRSEP